MIKLCCIDLYNERCITVFETVYLSSVIQPYDLIVLVIVPLISFMGFFGNALVCIAIWTDRRLQNTTNYFLFSLAIADMIVCILVMPLSLFVEFRNDFWTWTFSSCLLYTYTDVFFCSASIVHMTIISLDRYLGISDPLRQRNKSRSIVAMKILVVWVLTCIISSPLVVLAFYDNSNVLSDNECAINNRLFMLYGSILSFAIPLVIMAFTYILTTRLLSQQAKLLSSGNTKNPNDRSHINSGLRRTIVAQRKIPLKSSVSNKNSFNDKFLAHDKKENNRSLLSLSSKANSIGRSPLASNLFSKTDSIHNDDGLEEVGTPVNSELDPQTPDIELVQGLRYTLFHLRRPSASVLKLCSNFSSIYDHLTLSTPMIEHRTNNSLKRKAKKRRVKAELANERKATRVLAVVFTCFFVCWTPFFTMNFILAFCGIENCGAMIPKWVSFLFLWLGYLSSTLNPIIYTIFNRHFRQSFKNIVMCHYFYRKQQHSSTTANATTTNKTAHGYACRCLINGSSSTTVARNRHRCWQESFSFRSAAGSSSRSTVPICRPFKVNNIATEPMKRTVNVKRTLTLAPKALSLNERQKAPLFSNPLEHDPITSGRVSCSSSIGQWQQIRRVTSDYNGFRTLLFHRWMTTSTAAESEKNECIDSIYSFKSDSREVVIKSRSLKYRVNL